jgi:hypothetical protein
VKLYKRRFPSAKKLVGAGKFPKDKTAREKLRKVVIANHRAQLDRRAHGAHAKGRGDLQHLSSLLVLEGIEGNGEDEAEERGSHL